MFGRKKKKATEEVEQPLMVLEGSGASALLFQHKITIGHKGALSMMTKGMVGDKDIWLHTISGVQLKKPGHLTSGYIQFLFHGSQDLKGGLFAATQDENTIILKSKKDYESALKFKAEVEQLIIATQKPQLQHVPSTVSTADELAKLADLRDRGVISDLQFEQQRDKLFDN